MKKEKVKKRDIEIMENYIFGGGKGFKPYYYDGNAAWGFQCSTKRLEEIVRYAYKLGQSNPKKL